MMPTIEDFSDKTILAIETSTPVCSVALQAGGRQLVRSETGMGIHSEKTFQFIEELLREANVLPRDLDAVVLSGGPGSYTGLRIASSAAKGLLFGRKTELFSCETLASIAAGVEIQKSEQRVHTVLNARRTHLYHQLFVFNADGSLTNKVEAGIRPLSEIEAMLEKDDVLAGTGIQRLENGMLEASGIKTLRDADAISAQNMFYMLQNDIFRNYCKSEDTALYEPSYQPE